LVLLKKLEILQEEKIRRENETTNHKTFMIEQFEPVVDKIDKELIPNAKDIVENAIGITPNDIHNITRYIQYGYVILLSEYFNISPLCKRLS
jgi:hypothetical protein